MLHPLPSEMMDSFEVSTAVNNPTNVTPELINPVGFDQVGLEEFG